MAKDFEDNDGLDDEPVGQEDRGGDIVSPPTEEAMDVRTLIFLEGQVKAGEPLIDKVESTSAGDNYTEKTTIKLKSLSGCGHIAHVSSEAGLACLSCQRLGKKEPNVLCSECAKNPAITCYICSAACCYDCKRTRFIDGRTRVVCRACARSALLRRFVRQMIKWIVIAAAIYFLLAF